MKEIQIDFIGIARSEAKRKGLRLKDVAARLGISYPALHALLQGKPTFAGIERVADAIGIDPLDFFRAEEARQFVALVSYRGVPFRFNTMAQLETQLMVWRDLEEREIADAEIRDE